MKINHTTTLGRIVNNLQGGGARIIVSSLVLCVVFCFTVQAQDISLDENSAAAFIEELARDLKSSVGDEDAVSSIKEQWESRDLVGKTKSQAIALLLQDVRAVVDDPTIANGLRTKWLAKLRPAPAPLPPAPKKPSAPPLSDADMEEVMKWIAVNTAAKLLSFCYKQTLPRSCPRGMEVIGVAGVFCAEKCKAGYAQRGLTKFCYATCPEHFTDIGDYCQKPAPYGRGGGYPWQFGDALNLNAAKARCEAAQGAGNCEQSGEIFYPKCRPNYHAVGANICSPNCPPSWVDTGTGCQKPYYARDLEQSETVCPAGTNDVARICWQKCPSQHGHDCGLGCSTDEDACLSDIADKTMSVVGVALNLVTAGGAGSVSQSFKAAEKAIDTVGDAQNAVGAAQNILALVDQAANVFSANFASMTSDEINKKIDGSFSKEAATQIKKEYAKRHFRLTWEANTLAAAKQVAGLVSIVDQTGILAVANAFTNPVCGNDVPFPVVKPRY